MNLQCSFRCIAVAVLLIPSLSFAISCDELRAEVAAKIRSAGVQDFSVSIVEADAPSTGKVVGSCDNGAGKLLYIRSAPAGEAAGVAPLAPTRSGSIVTECKDGSIPANGVCPP